jgi:hypothetical protein
VLQKVPVGTETQQRRAARAIAAAVHAGARERVVARFVRAADFAETVGDLRRRTRRDGLGAVEVRAILATARAFGL